MATAVTFNDVTAQEFADRVHISNVLGSRPGNIYYVSSVNGSSTNDGTSAAGPKATLAQAVALCSNSRNDTVIVLPGHAETLSTTTQGIAIASIGVNIIGMGNARNRPAITCGAANIVGVLLSGTSNLIKNIRFIGSTSQTTATSAILSITGTDNTIEGCVFEHGGAGPLVACLMTAAHRTQWLKCKWLGTSAGPDVGIKIGSTSQDCIFRDLDFQYGVSAGLDSAAISGAASAAIGGGIIQRLCCVGMDVGVVDINGSGVGTTVDSMMSEVYAACYVGTTLAAAFDLGSTAIMNSFYTDAVAAGTVHAGVAYRGGPSSAIVLGTFPSATGAT